MKFQSYFPSRPISLAHGALRSRGIPVPTCLMGPAARPTTDAEGDPNFPCARVERLPGLQSSKLGLESLTGELDDFSFDSYLNLPSESEVAPPDVHSVMEARLGLDTKPCKRAVF